MTATEAAVATPFVKYLYLDVVGFSKRTAEAQVDVITALNRIATRVVAALPSHELHQVEAYATVIGTRERQIYLPTGDGLCICLLDPLWPYDVHLHVGLEILRLVDEWNEAQTDDQRRFQVRIGLNHNYDNLVVDINNRPNLAGAGINYSQRVMNFADGNQILVSEAVYDVLRYRERYAHSFRRYAGVAKHGVNLNVYQFIDGSFPFLSSDSPAAFDPVPFVAPKLTILEAAYCYFALVFRAAFQEQLSRDPDEVESAILALYSLARQVEDTSNHNALVGRATSPLDELRISFAEFMDRGRQIADGWTRQVLVELIGERFAPLARYFVQAGVKKYLLLNAAGEEKLQEDYETFWKSAQRYFLPTLPRLA